MTTLLADPYYSDAHEVFRAATDQTEKMLDRLVDRLQGRSRLSICSVGSGVGLFELPMLARLRAEGIGLARFTGVDASAHAASVLQRKLEAVDSAGLEFDVVVGAFQDYETSARFDLVLFNHVLEYLQGAATESLARSRTLLTADGAVVVFSPTRGGINRPYEDTYAELTGAPPVFADDIERLLDEAVIGYTRETILASCDISALDRAGNDEEKMALLSFLTQRDCRELPEEARERYVDYYRLLRRAGESGIAHPTALFVL